MSVFHHFWQEDKETKIEIWKLQLGKPIKTVYWSISSISLSHTVIQHFQLLVITAWGWRVGKVTKLVTYVKNLLDLQTNKKGTVNINISGQLGRLTILQL